MDRLTRRELKRDAFAREVTHTVEYVSEHRQQFVRYGIVALAVLVVAGGVYFFSKRQAANRAEALAAAVQIQEAPIAPASPNPAIKTFPTEEARNDASTKAFTELAAGYSGSEEAAIAKYYLGTIAAHQRRWNDAANFLKEAADSKDPSYASLAQLVLADVYQAQGRTDEAEKVLRGLLEKPTMFVSKTQATVALARLLAPVKPAEARKLLEPLRLEAGPGARAAFEILNTLPDKS